MVLNKLAYRLNLTKEIRIELSDKLNEIAYVTKKSLEKSSLQLSSCPTIVTHPKYKLILEFGSSQIEIDSKELYDQVELNDRVNLIFKKKFSVTYNYIPPNFKTKQKIKSELTGYEIISTEIIK